MSEEIYDDMYQAWHAEELNKLKEEQELPSLDEPKVGDKQWMRALAMEIFQQ